MVKGNTFSNGVCCLQVNNPDGIVSGGNQFKVNEHGVILGNVGTGGSVQVSPLSCSLLQKFAQSSKCNRDKIHTYKHITGIHAMRITFPGGTTICLPQQGHVLRSWRMMVA